MINSRARNDALRDAISQANITYEGLARAVRQVAAESGDSLRTSKSAVGNWIAGQPPASTTASYIAEALSRRLGRAVTAHELGLTDTERPEAHLGLHLGPDPVDMLCRLGEADMRRRKLLTSAVYSVAAAALPLGTQQATEHADRTRTAARGGAVGDAELDAVADMTRVFTAIDERHGGQHGRSAVVQYLTSDVAALCRGRFRNQELRAEMLSAAASVAYLVGWKAYDAGEHGLAQRYYLQAYALTREADNPLHAAFILRILAHNGMDLNQPQHTLELADAACDRVLGRAAPATEAMFIVTRARALANARRGREAVAEISRAQALVADSEEMDLPRWAALWGSARACVQSHSAKTLKALGDWRGAEEHYATARYARPGVQFRRITALTAAAEGTMQVRQGHVDQACDTWARSLEMLEGVRSARAVDAVAGIRRDLRPVLKRGARTAADLDEHARTWQLAHA